MSLMTSGATHKDAPSATTGLAHTMGFNECEQIAHMMEIVENQSLSEHICSVSTWRFLCIVIASFEMMDIVSNKFRKIHADQGDGLSELRCLGVLGLEVHTVEP